MEVSGRHNEEDGVCKKLNKADHGLCIYSLFHYYSERKIVWEILSTKGAPARRPLFPIYMFILVAQAFSNILQQAKEKDLFHGGQVSKRAPSVSHLFFADDSLLFAKADERETGEIARLINLYCQASGQNINLQKSIIYFSSNVPSGMRRIIMTKLGLSTQALNGAYLGLPTRVGRSKNNLLQSIMSRVWKRIQGWKK